MKLGLRKSATDKPKKMKRPRPPKPKSSWLMAKAAFRQWRANWAKYGLIAVAVSVPLNLLEINSAVNSEPHVSALALVALSMMNIALIWAIGRHAETGKVPTVAQAYYDGSVALVRSAFVGLMLVLTLIPVAIAAAVYVIVALSVEYGFSTAIEEVVIGLICLLVASISGWLIVRFGLAMIAVVVDGLRPIAAMRYARLLTLGRFWRTAARFAGLILFLFVLSIPLSAVAALLAVLKLNMVATIFYGIASSIVILPMTNLYLYDLYRNLEATLPEPNEPEPQPVSA